ncbi:HEAT repeat domain-containing protein [Paenibacillaceae bacterium]|nr:HEAT repeat domain-containing protein [Paenibacillaceae bacterium]
MIGRPESVKDRMLELIRQSRDDYDIVYTLWTLRDLGLAEALPDVLAHLESPNGEIRSLALRFFSEFGGVEYVPQFVAALNNDKSPDVKWTAMDALDRWGGPSEVKAVMNRLKRIVSRQRKGGGQFPVSELMYGISFLCKEAKEQEDVRKLLLSLQTSKSDKLFEHERDWLAKLMVETDGPKDSDATMSNNAIR